MIGPPQNDKQQRKRPGNPVFDHIYIIFGRECGEKDQTPQYQESFQSHPLKHIFNLLFHSYNNFIYFFFFFAKKITTST